MRSLLPWSLLAFLALGCTPVLGAGGLPFLLGFGLIIGLGFALTAQAGPKAERAAVAPTGEGTGGAPMPRPKCEGWEHKSCRQGRIAYSCCPKGAKCNYRLSAFQDCGYERCVPGNDPGMCPPDQPMGSAAAKEADCPAGWAKACIDGKLAQMCVMPVPTNFTGPSNNPSFRTCGGDYCTTSRFIDACYPTKEVVKTCAVPFTKVCLMGVVTERCIPAGAPTSAASKGFVMCDATRCAIGDKSACGGL